MTTTSEDRLRAVIAAMVTDHDVTDSLAQLLIACAEAYPADAVSILVRDESGDLELLSSTSHEVASLELLQIQSSYGPCVEALRTDRAILTLGADALVEKWGEVGEAIVAAGFDEAHAYPMHWRGEPIGGLNIFVSNGRGADLETGQFFADLATLVMMQSNDLSSEQIGSRIHEAVSAREVVEQAKGVLAYRDGLSMEGAYAALLTEARDAGQRLSRVAASVVAREHEGSDRS